ncbi:hypothetical protein ABZ611_10355 [Streptomyces sp. NPDC007861]|uniref:hypothetical protein n=1 Tax=Streptomyces sp. NPDC007861 TaxID=3154893 RepID=UPI0033F6A114
MLASVPTVWLWLMAAAATAVACTALGAWIPDRKFRIWLPVILVVCGLGMAAYGRLFGHELGQMLVLYSFTLIGLTIGLFPTRKLMTTYAEEINRGVKRESYAYPRSHMVFLVFVVVAMAFAAFVLTQ